MQHLNRPERPVGLDGHRHAVELPPERHLTRHPAAHGGVLGDVRQERFVVQVHLGQQRHDARGQHHVRVGAAHGGDDGACLCTYIGV